MTGNSGSRRWDGRCQAIAHRGDPFRHRENTLPSIASALKGGADLVEIDVRATADGYPVLLHDTTLERLWGDPRDVATVPCSELDVLATDQYRIPTLAEALQLMAGSTAALLLDVDGAQIPNTVEVVHEAGRRPFAPAPVVWCGRPYTLFEVRRHDPGACLMLSWDDDVAGGALPSDDIVATLQPEVFNPQWPLLNDGVIQWAHRHDLALSCWTVDDSQQMRTLIDRGVNAMITNRIRQLTLLTSGLDQAE